MLDDVFFVIQLAPTLTGKCHSMNHTLLRKRMPYPLRWRSKASVHLRNDAKMFLTTEEKVGVISRKCQIYFFKTMMIFSASKS